MTSHLPDSAIFIGHVQHRRFYPRHHAFKYRLFMLFLELGKLGTILEDIPLLDGRFPWFIRFKRSDYHGDPQVNLDQAVRDTIEHFAGRRPTGAIYMLTHLRYFNYCFNPITLYYAYQPDGSGLDTILADVTNTPWKERCSYILPVDQNSHQGDVYHFKAGKKLHVSPFMDMDHNYEFRLSEPGRTLSVHINSFRDDIKYFDATLNLEKRKLTTTALIRTALHYPFMTGKVTAAIHWQALRIWMKRIPYYKHPLKRTIGTDHA
jgi:DUF1365 family protein